VARADGDGGVHACRWGPHPYQFRVDISRRRDEMIFNYLKNVL
jgi:hypothetical protein